MRQIKDVETALRLFEEASIIQEKATDSGNYKTGNKAYSAICKATNYLKKNNALLQLKKFFTHPSVGPRSCAATYLLPVIENESVHILTDITTRPDIHGGIAKLTLQEWQKGNLRDIYKSSTMNVR